VAERRKKAEPEEICPKCGSPELNTWARQTTEGVRVYTSCAACSHIIVTPEPVRRLIEEEL
jgi:formate dehydrogenase maturation protein FdhE